MEPLTHREEDPGNDELEPVEGGKAMGFLEHLDELRQVVIRCILAFLVSLIVVIAFMPSMMAYLQYPLKQAVEAGQVTLVTSSPLGVFTVIFQIAFLGAFILSLPFMLYFVGGFVAPALMEREKRILRPVSLASIALFLLGVNFAYHLIVPATVNVSILLNKEMGFEVLWTADRYYSMLIWLVLGLGGAFQFPLVLLLLVKIGLLSSEKMGSWRRYAVVILLIFAAIVTPTPDPFTQLMVATPLYVLYEIAIIAARMIERRIAAETL
jgi:sec-independent protein translocase protein TatC